ncbi:MAG TPA: hypothetical protein PKM21_03010 [Anaerolineales bacterium]|nr:hypothetical protein [Anaerolineales bacterium]
MNANSNVVNQHLGYNPREKVKQLGEQLVRLRAERDARAETERQELAEASARGAAVSTLQEKWDNWRGVNARAIELAENELKTVTAQLQNVQAREQAERGKAEGELKEKALMAWQTNGGDPGEFEARWPALRGALLEKKTLETLSRM